MTRSTSSEPSTPSSQAAGGLFRTEDWWSVWLGLGLVVISILLYLLDFSLKLLVIKPPKWTEFGQLLGHFASHLPAYAALCALWAGLLAGSLRAMGQEVREFLWSFVFVFLAAMVIFVIGSWEQASRYNFEPPLVALILGMVIGNFAPLPAWMDAGFRVEYYIKIGIVLLGATLPFTLIVWAGPVAIVQATIVSVSTFAIIYGLARHADLDRRLCACLGAGGAVCGVSGAIAMAGAVRATKEQVSVAITLVIVWAMFLIFFLPFAAKALHLPAAVAGAWIGTSELADAAGLAAAQTYGAMAQHLDFIEGTEEQAIHAFTLIKVIGRDAWIGIWAFIFALIATLRWETDAGAERPKAAEIWQRLPKFVLGFLAASLLMSAFTAGYNYADYKKLVEPDLVAPLKDLRTWAFIFCFFSIGLTTRFRDLAHVGMRPLRAFSLGVVINVMLGALLSIFVFAHYWQGIGI